MKKTAAQTLVPPYTNPRFGTLPQEFDTLENFAEHMVKNGWFAKKTTSRGTTYTLTKKGEKRFPQCERQEEPCLTTWSHAPIGSA